MFEHILIPTDGSKLSDNAAAGVELARALGARVTGFFAAPAATPLVYEDLLPASDLPPDEHAKPMARAAARCTRMAGSSAGCPASPGCDGRR